MLPRIPFIFVRHGQTASNRRHLWQGQTDIPLDIAGIMQAVRARQRLEKAGIRIGFFFASTLVRAHRTARLVAGEKSHIPMLLDHRLMERGFGSFEGLNWKEMRAKHGIKENESHEHILPPDAEDKQAFRKRVLDITGHYLAHYGHMNIAFVSHAGVLNEVLAELLPGAGYFPAKNGVPYRFAPVGTTGWTFEEV